MTGVNTNVPCKGNGTVIGMTNGTNTVGLNTYASSNGVDAYTGMYGKSVGTENTTGRINNKKGLGLTTDATKSGIVGTVTRSVFSVKFVIKF